VADLDHRLARIDAAFVANADPAAATVPSITAFDDPANSNGEKTFGSPAAMTVPQSTSQDAPESSRIQAHST